MTLIYFAGLFGVINKEKIFIRRLIIGVLYSIIYIVYGFYFKSLYEEAVVLALSPWIFMGLQDMRDRGRYRVFLISAILVLMSKVQMIFLVPLLVAAIFYIGDKSAGYRKKSVISAFILLTAIASYANEIDPNAALRVANYYNRFYNGIGWSLQQVSSWPVNSYQGRQQYFEENRQFLQQATNTYEYYNPDQNILGTAYWPTGKYLMDHYAAEHPNYLKTIFDRGNFSNFLVFMARRPGLIPAYLKNIYLVSLNSDYNIRYVRTDGQYKSGSLHFARQIVQLFLQWAGYIWFIACLTILFIRPQSIKTIVTLYFFLGAPLFIVLGDGFYEFEKHMMAYLVLAPLPAFLLFYDGKTNKQSNNDVESSMPASA